MEKMPNLLTSKPIVYLVNMSATDYTRKKNKWLPKIHAWIQEHGGGVMIPFSVEFEAKLWEMRENPSAKQVRAGHTMLLILCHVAAVGLSPDCTTLHDCAVDGRW
jgi:ribosome-binding ATPase YchF (GTP1/OBG family)